MRLRSRLSLPSRFGFGILFLALALGTLVPALLAQEEELPLNFDAVAVNMSNVGPRGQVRLQIRVNRWSTEEERNALREIVKTQSGRRGERQLADGLFSKESVGTIRESRTLAYDLRYARELPSEVGRMIVLATDRRIGFAEAMRASRTLDYNVTLIILNLDENGNGDGQVMLGAQLAWDDVNEQLIIEHFSSEPIRLTRVRMR